MTDAQRSLQEVDRQRAALADRIRLPRWYSCLYAGALLVLFVLPGLSVRPGHHLSHATVTIVIVACVVVLVLADAVMRRASGARLPADRAGAYVSARRPIMRTGWIVLAGSVATWAAAEAASWVLSIALGVAVAALAMRGQRQTLAAIRHDIRSGRVAPR